MTMLKNKLEAGSDVSGSPLTTEVKCDLLVIVSGPASAEILGPAVSRAKADGRSVATVSMTPEAKGALSAKGVESRLLEEYAFAAKGIDIDEEAVALINDLPVRKLADGTPFGSLLEYERIPLWEFASPWLYLDVQEVYKRITVADMLCSQEKPRALLTLDAETVPVAWAHLWGTKWDPWLQERAIQAVGRARGIPVETLSLPTSVRRKAWATALVGRLLQRLSWGVWSMLAFGVVRSIAEAISERIVPARRESAARCRYLFFSYPTYWRKEQNPLAGGTAPTDVIIYPVIAALRDIEPQGEVVALEGQISVAGNLKKTFQKLFREPSVKWHSFDGYVPASFTWRPYLKIRRAYRTLRRRGAFDNLAAVRGVPLWPFLSLRMDYLFDDYLWRAILWIRAGRRAVAALRPDVVALTYETGPQSRAILNACWERGIPTLGIQHGAFRPTAADYWKTEATNTPRLTPERMAVYSENFRRILVERNVYGEDQVIVTGNVQTDVIARADDFFDAEAIRGAYGLELGRPLVLVATARTREGKLRDTFRRAVMDAILKAKEAYPEVQWVLKTNPAEAPDFYLQTLAERGIDDVVVAIDGFYDLLYACDVVVTPPSTVLYEGILFGKPVVNLVLAGTEDIFGDLVSGGLVEGAYSAEELIDVVGRLLHRRESPVDRRRIKEYCEETGLDTGGRASENIASLIRELVVSGSTRLRETTPCS